MTQSVMNGMPTRSDGHDKWRARGNAAQDAPRPIQGVACLAAEPGICATTRMPAPCCPDRDPTQGTPMARNTASALQALIKKLRGLLSRVAGGTPSQQQPPEPATPAVQLPEPQAPVRTRRAKPGKKPHKPAPPTPTAKPAAPACPHCRKTMVIKVARTGKNAGEFWGCVAYPTCRGIRPIFR